MNPYYRSPDPQWNPQNELQVLQELEKLGSPNVLTYFGKFYVHMDGPSQWLIICTEVCDGSLRQFLNLGIFQGQNQLQRIATFWDILRQILHGWQCCYQKNLIHRDIKLSNSNHPPLLLNGYLYSFLFGETNHRW